MKVTGKIRPLRDSVFVTDMEFGEQRTTSGIVLVSDDGKAQGIHPRWCKVWAVGSAQQDVKVNDWILVEHGRWTRTIEVEDNAGTTEVRMVDAAAIMMISNELPTDVMRTSV
jgi:co-chaperonin GroES (HSP10)